MSWNYRVCKDVHTGEYSTGEKWETITYGIHEVYYNSEGEITGITESPMPVLADTAPGTDLETEDECVANLRTVIEMMTQAFHRPVVDTTTIEYAE